MIMKSQPFFLQPSLKALILLFGELIVIIKKPTYITTNKNKCIFKKSIMLRNLLLKLTLKTPSS